MQIQVRKLKSRTGKERIIFTLRADKSAQDKKIIRSIASANFGETILLQDRPPVELVVVSDQKYRVLVRIQAPEDSRPELKDLKPPVFDVGEQEALFRTAKAHILAKQLGIRIPFSLAKKYSCRCGSVFVYPKELREHRTVCSLLHSVEKDLLARGNSLLARITAEDIAALPKKIVKQRETFPCRCGHVFTKKAKLTKHQKLCSVLADVSDLFDQGQSYLDRHKHESKTRAGKNRQTTTSMGKQTSDSSVKRNTRRSRATKRVVRKTSAR